MKFFTVTSAVVYAMRFGLLFLISSRLWKGLQLAVMSNGFITTEDGTRIFYKDWVRRTHSPSSSTTAGR